jgi:hypothetical protein
LFWQAQIPEPCRLTLLLLNGTNWTYWHEDVCFQLYHSSVEDRKYDGCFGQPPIPWLTLAFVRIFQKARLSFEKQSNCIAAMMLAKVVDDSKKKTAEWSLDVSKKECAKEMCCELENVVTSEYEIAVKRHVSLFYFKAKEFCEKM